MDFARHGYDLRITCAACGHVVKMKPLELLPSFNRRSQSLHIEALEVRMRCRACSNRQATIQATTAAD